MMGAPIALSASIIDSNTDAGVMYQSAEKLVANNGTEGRLLSQQQLQQEEVQQNQNRCNYVTATGTLGDGNFSVVKECMNVHTQERYAMKIVPRKLISGRMQLIEREIAVLKYISKQIRVLEGEGEVDGEEAEKEGRLAALLSKTTKPGIIDRQGTFDGHHHVLQLFDYFETRDNIVLVTQLCAQGDLYDKIIDAGSLDVHKQVRPYTACLLSALNFLHKSGVIHRDIKAENILFRVRNEPPPKDSPYDLRAHDLIIADFGLAISEHSEDKSVFKEYVGTLSYLAPEMIRCKDVQRMNPTEVASIREYGRSIDVWALGVLCYFMVGGYMPFDCEDDQETSDCILQCDYYVDEEAQRVGDADFKACWNFIQRCFTFDDSKRPSAQDLMSHPFVREYFQAVSPFDFSAVPIMERSKSSNSIHHLGPPVRSDFGSSELSSSASSTALVSMQAVSSTNDKLNPFKRVNSRDHALNALRDTLRKTLSLTSIEPMYNAAARNLLASINSSSTNAPSLPHSNRKNSTFVLRPQPPISALMNGCYSMTPESRSDFTTTPSMSRGISTNNVNDTTDTAKSSVTSQDADDAKDSGITFGSRGRTVFQVGEEDEMDCD